MVNGHGLCHGGFIFTLADSAFAFACNSYNQRTVGAPAADHLFGARPSRRAAHRGRARERQRAGRTGIYDVRVTNEHGERDRGIPRPFPHREGNPPAGDPAPATIWEAEENASRADPPRAGSSRSRPPRATRSPPLQLERLRLDAAPRLRQRRRIYRKRVRRRRRASGRSPDRSTTSPSSRSPPSRTCATTTRSACSPCRASRSSASTPRSGTTGKPTVVGYTAERHRHLGRRDGPLDPRRRRPARRHACTSPTATACSPAGSGAHYGAERLGCTVIPISGGMTERQVQLIQRLQARHHHGHAVLHAGDPRRVPRARASIRAQPSLQDRHLRRRAVDQRHARARSSRPSTCDAVDIYGLSEVMGPGRRQRVRRDQGRPAHLGGPLLSRDHRPADRRGAARRRAGRARLHLAHQGGACR